MNRQTTPTRSRPSAFPAPAGAPNRSGACVSHLIVTFHSAEEIRDCLDSILAQELRVPAETIVIDNDSNDGTPDIIRDEYPTVKLIESGRNAGFAAANNLALEHVTGQYLVLVNPDSILQPDAVAAALAYLEDHPKCGIVGGLLTDEDGTPHPSARLFPTGWNKLLMLSGLAERFSGSRFFGAGDFRWFDHRKPLAVDWVPGAFTVIRRGMIEEIGFFDERFFLYYEETDLCLRAREYGWETHFLPDSVIVHEGGASGKKLEGEVFDDAGGQVRHFRMMAECLYHRKNSGLPSLLWNIGVEWGWHQLRRLVNLRPGETARRKRAYSKGVVTGLEAALRETSLGRISPPKPWSSPASR